MRRQLTVALMPVLALLVLPADADQMSYPCYRADVAPVLDGQVGDDPAWANMPTATGFSVLGGGFAEAKQTSFQACWDDEALYVAVVCEEPDVADMRPQIRDGGDTWLEDGVEVFLQPGGRQVYQFVVTAGAARGSGEGAPDMLRYQAAAGTGPGSYALEIRIPHELLGAAPRLGDRWRGNVCRNIFTTISGGDKFTSWAPLDRRFLEPEHFAVIEFRGPAPDADEAAAIGEAINARYRPHLLAELRSVAAAGQDYLPVLDEARRDETFGREARRLRYEWQKFARVERSAESFAVTELRTMLLSADDLVSASYDLKYAYLIVALFPD